MVSEFRTFIVRGNVVDLAVGIVIGAAFGTVVKSFVDDILMPPVGLLFGGVDFSDLFIDLSGGGYATLESARQAGAATINYGMFLNNVIAFLIVAFAVFLVARTYTRMRAAEAASVLAKDCTFCRMPIPVAAVRCGHCTSNLS